MALYRTIEPIVLRKLLHSGSWKCLICSPILQQNVIGHHLMPSTTISSTSSKKTHQRGIPEKAGTTVLVLHADEPRSYFYAKSYLDQLLRRHFHLPSWLSSTLTELYFKFTNLPKQCVQNSVNYPLHLDSIREFTNKLEHSVSQLIPEFGPIRCLPASENERPNVEMQLERTFRNGLDHLIILYFSPLLQSNRISYQLSMIKSRIRSKASILQHEEDNVAEYVLKNSPSSFSLLVVDRLPKSECFVQYWASRLVPLLDHYEVIVFTTTYPVLECFEFSHCVNDLEEVSRRIMYAAYKHSSRTTSWRISFYSGWELPIGRVLCFNRMSIQSCLTKLKKKGRKGPVLVVPLDSLLPGFNTKTALPKSLGKLADDDGFVVNILQPEPEDKALVHSMAELIKHIMLNPEKFSR